MDISNLVALIISAASLIISIYFASGQSSLQRLSNHVPILGIISGFREPDLIAGFEAVADLSQYDPAVGISGLPVDVRLNVYRVCYFLQEMAMYMLLGMIDERKVTLVVRARLLHVWATVEPFVKVERQLNAQAGPEFLAMLEVFAKKAETISPEVGHKILAKWAQRKA